MNHPLKKLKVILVGDNCIDEYQYGVVNRLSPEAPVPIFVPNKTETRYGMAANVLENLKKLNIEVVSYLGRQSRKIRLIDEKTNQHLLRIDSDIISTPLSSADVCISNDIDAIVISDYDKGFVSYELIEELIATNIPVFVDTKKTDLQRLNGAILKINLIEYNKAKTLPEKIIVTLGKDGAKFNNKIFKAPSIEITDVCGAGDTFLASLTYKYLITNDIEESIKFAILASSITVKHRGVYAPTLDEIRGLKIK